MESVISNNQLMLFLKQSFGTNVELVNQKIANQSHDYLVLIAQLQHPSIDVVIKLAGPDASMAGSFERTAMLQRLVTTNTTIPMPEILAVDQSYHVFPWRYLVMTYIPGQEWAAVRKQMSLEELPHTYQQIGSAVAQLHSIQFQSFGELTLDGSIQGSGSFFSALSERAKRSINSSYLRDLFFSILDRERYLFLDVHQPRLCHEDLHGYNILFEYRQGQWHLATILDFDKAWAGHHEIDLARLEFWRGMVSTAFWQAYNEICQADSLYEQRRPIYQLLWCFEFARNTSQHLKDTQALCSKLGLPCPERFA